MHDEQRQELGSRATLKPLNPAMIRQLSLLLLVVLLAGFAASGMSAPHAQSTQAVVLSQTSGDSGPMAAMACGACTATSACIASAPAQGAGLGISRLPPRQPASPQLSDQTCAPDTAPPKRLPS